MWYAVKNYCNYLKENNVDNKYIKMGSTFVNEGILDYLKGDDANEQVS